MSQLKTNMKNTLVKAEVNLNKVKLVQFKPKFNLNNNMANM